MGLDGTFGTASREGDLLVGVAANDKQKDFPLARRQCRDMSANDVQLAVQGYASLRDAQSPARLPEEDHSMIPVWSESHPHPP